MTEATHDEILTAVARVETKLDANTGKLNEMNGRLTVIEKEAAEERGAIKLGKWLLVTIVSIGGLALVAWKTFGGGDT